MTPITEFRGEYFFLSNYYTHPLTWRGVEFHSAEQAFAYAKAAFAKAPANVSVYESQVLSTAAPGEAKKAGRNFSIDIDEWDKHKVRYMREIVHAKFLTGTGIVGPLINTGAVMLVEGNDWGDSFWGRVKGSDGVWRGLNTLGVILMEERGWWSRGSEGRGKM